MIEVTSPTNRTAHTVTGDQGLVARCPDCDGRDFLVQGDDAVLLACLSCDSHWRDARGEVWRVDHRPHPRPTTVVS